MLKLLYLSAISAIVSFAADVPKLPPELQIIIDQAQAAPPEFSSEILLRIVEKAKLKSPAQKRELIEQAFHLAAAAHFKVRMGPIPRLLGDSRQGSLVLAYSLGLDATTLQSRAIRDMAGVDGRRAREMFTEMAHPALPPLTCQSALVYEPSAYYDALEAAFANGFTPAERKKEEDIGFLLAAAGQASSASELQPLARVIKNVRVSGDTREVLYARLGALFETAAADDRSFAAIANSLVSDIPPTLSDAFSKLLIKQLTASRCEGIDEPATTQPQPDENGSRRAKLDLYWQTGSGKALLADLLRLRTNQNSQNRSPAERATSGWKQMLTDFLAELDNWRASDENNSTDFFNEKCLAYEASIDLLEAGPERERLIAVFVSFLANSNLQQTSPVEWFSQAHNLYDHVQYDPGKRSDLLNQLEQSPSPILALFARAERQFFSPIPPWVGTSPPI